MVMFARRACVVRPALRKDYVAYNLRLEHNAVRCHHATFVTLDKANEQALRNTMEIVRMVTTTGASRAYCCLRNRVAAVDTFGGFDSLGAPGPA
jgi:hypothetical protein